MKKLRQDSVAANLPPYLRDAVDEMFFSGTTYKAVQERVAEDGISWSLTSIAQYYHNHVQPLMATRRQDIAAKLNKMDAEGLDEASLQAVRMTVFDLASAPGGDPKTLKIFMDLVIKAQQMKLDERKLSLLEQKAAEAKRLAEDTLNSARKGLSAETIAEVEERLKLL